MKLTEAQRWVLERAVGNGGKIQTETVRRAGNGQRQKLIARLLKVGLVLKLEAGFYITRAGRAAVQGEQIDVVVAHSARDLGPSLVRRWRRSVSEA